MRSDLLWGHFFPDSFFPERLIFEPAGKGGDNFKYVCRQGSYRIECLFFFMYICACENLVFFFGFFESFEFRGSGLWMLDIVV